MEKIINVPLDERQIEQLKKRADANDRAMGREASRIIRIALEKGDRAK